MAISPPKIDERNQADLVAQLNSLLKYYVGEWKDGTTLENDRQAQTLIKIYARMMEIIIQRLNRVPEKNFLSFLELIGVELSSPKVAQAPLTFTMAAGAKQFGFIKAGTQVAAEQDETIIFETEKDLMVILPKLVKAISLDPQNDRWHDHSPLFFNNPARTGEELFKGEELIPHRLYLGHKKFFGGKEPLTVALQIELSQELIPDSSQKWEVKWYCDREGKRIPLKPFGINLQNEADPGVTNLLKSGVIRFPYLCNISETILHGVETKSQEIKDWKNYWLVAELATPISGISASRLPELKNVTVGIEINTPAIQAPGTISSQNLKVNGAKTGFKQIGLKKGDRIIAQSQIRIVALDPDSDTELTIDRAFEPDLPEGTAFAYTPCGTGTISNIDGDWYLYTPSPDIDNFKNEIQTGQYIIAGGETRVIGNVDPVYKKFQLNSAFHWKTPAGTNFYYLPGPPQLLLDAAFYNNNPLDITKDFWPFGERPRKLNDTFYIASKEVFSKTGAQVVMGVKLSAAGGANPEGVALSWEFWDGKAWNRFDNPRYNFNDETMAFTVNDKTITFKMPDNQLAIVNGKEDYWLRVRIIDGGYGSPSQYYEQTADQPHYLVIVKQTLEGPRKYKIIDGEPEELTAQERTEWIVTQETFQPPCIQEITLSYVMQSETGPPENMVTYNDFMYLDKSGTGRDLQTVFQPFTPVRDKQAALYLAFDQDIGGLPVNLFFPLLANNDGTGNPASISTVPPVIAWEYWNGKNWASLSGEDETENLTRRERVEFLIPDNFRKQYRFESELYWLRARLDKGAYQFPPKVWTICTNTVWAHHLSTVHDEILGSSNGKPNQTFKLHGTPVLPGQQIMVREPALSEAERAQILAEEGKDAIDEIKDSAGNIVELWVRWHEVDSFHFSESIHRHYLIDRNTGRITFGDALRGMIPLNGKNNIKCKFYQYGGGSKGNVKAGVITKLRTTFPYIDSVTNPEAADGGFDQENLERALVRGPQTLKHKNRAVTYEDFEWLAKEASTKITKAKCLPVTDANLQYRPGWVTVIIVPESDDPKPYPSQELIRTVEEYLFDRTSTYLAGYPSQIHLTGPGYIGIGVEVTVKYTSISAAKIVEGRIYDLLQKYFHPLHGGPEGRGWDFGRSVYISEIYAAIESVAGVDHIVDLSLRAPVQLYTMTTAMTTGDITGTIVYPRLSNIKSGDGKIVMSLAEAVTITKDLPVGKMVVSGFKEGDRINLKSQHHSLSLVIKSIIHENDGDILEIEPFTTELKFPVGSLVETGDQRIQSFILNEVPENSRVQYLKIAVFEVNDSFTISRGQHDQDPHYIKSGTIQAISDRLTTVFIDSNYLVYSGNHVVHSAIDNGNPEMLSKTGNNDDQVGSNLIFPYVINTKTREIHHAAHATVINKGNRRYLTSLDEQLMNDLKLDYCAYCFGKDMSTR